MDEVHLYKCSTSLVIKEIPVKRTLRFYLTPMNMAKIKNSVNSMYWWGCEERGILFHCWWDWKLVQYENQSGLFLENWKHSYLKAQKYCSWACSQKMLHQPQIHWLHYVHSRLTHNGRKLETTSVSKLRNE